jgi:hypothetical protein
LKCGKCDTTVAALLLSHRASPITNGNLEEATLSTSKKKGNGPKEIMIGQSKWKILESGKWKL